MLCGGSTCSKEEKNWFWYKNNSSYQTDFFKVNIPTKYYFYLVGLPDLKAWGKKRSKFYGADISDDDIGKKAV